MDKVELNEDLRVAVIGAGIAGLSTATRLQAVAPNIQVDLIADKFTVDTCSDGAAGLFHPGRMFRGPDLQTTRAILQSSLNHYNRLLINHPGDAQSGGIIRLEGYKISTFDPSLSKSALLEDIIPSFRPAARQELNSFGGDHKYGTFYSTLLTDCRKYLPFLTHKFESNGGALMIRKLNSFEELANDYDLVLNCSGLGALYLCNDTAVTPIRGQVFKVKAPWIKRFIFSDNDTYIIPGAESITLGGTRQFDSYKTTVDAYDSASIWERCTTVCPSLKDAKIEREWVGLRPYRPKVRLEKETMTFEGGKSINIVHNYGHGGYGVMSAPGCAEYAVDLAMQFINPKQSSKL